MSADGILHSRRFRWVNFYPPFLGAGIRILHRESNDYTLKVQLKLTRFNRNAVGTHFGGFIVCDVRSLLHAHSDAASWSRIHGVG